MTSASLIHEQGTQSRCSGTAQRDGVGKGSGSGVQDGGTQAHPGVIHVSVWQKPPQHCQEIILQLK